MSGRGLVAWIEPQGSHYVAAYVSAKTRWLRDPATRLFSAAQEARRVGWSKRQPRWVAFPSSGKTSRRLAAQTGLPEYCAVWGG